jgi:dihydrofolate reductase
MRKLILKMSMSIDGFVAGPNGEIDWLFRLPDDEATAWTVAAIGSAGIHAMGRKSWQDMAAYWPTSTEAFAPAMNDLPKVVFTRAGLGADARATTRGLEDARAQGNATKAADPEVVRGWTHPRVAAGDMADEVARLKQEPGADIVAHGGASFAQSLVQLDLVDEYKLLIHPVALGRGLPLFARATRPLDLALVDVKAFPKGAVAHVYARRNDAKHG